MSPILAHVTVNTHAAVDFKISAQINALLGEVVNEKNSKYNANIWLYVVYHFRRKNSKHGERNLISGKWKTGGGCWETLDSLENYLNFMWVSHDKPIFN